MVRRDLDQVEPEDRPAARDADEGQVQPAGFSSVAHAAHPLLRPRVTAMSAGGDGERLGDMVDRTRCLGVVTSGLLRSRRIRRILALKGWRMVYAPLSLRLDAVAGWGEKPAAATAKRIAARRGLDYVTLEDGFLRSSGLGVDGDDPLSIVIDPHGAYVNHRVESGLFRLLIDPSWETAALRHRAAAGRATLRRRRLSKYNHAPPLRAGALPERFVLVIDQTVGDAAIAGAGADAARFEAAARAAIAEAGGLPVVVKTHPDVLAGKRQGFLAADARGAGAQVFAENANPWDLIERSAAVYTVSSLMGYEAALGGAPVHCFAWPFYSGWGFTRDRAERPTGLRRVERAVDAAFAASHLLYPVYYDPDRDALCDFETVAAQLSAAAARR